MEGRGWECGQRKSRSSLEAQWQGVRRGGSLGGPTFKGKLLGRIGAWLEGRPADSVGGEAVRALGEADGERWVGSAVEGLGLAEESLERLPKGAREKLGMAWWLRGHTTLSYQWIAQRLQMGHETRVRLAVREVLRRKGGPLAKPKRRLQAVRRPDDS